MTVDTAALRAQAMDDIDNMRDLTGRSDLGPREVIALCDALEAERERVRQLYQFLIEWDGQDSFREPDYRDQLQERYCAWIATAEAALAEEGETP